MYYITHLFSEFSICIGTQLQKYVSMDSHDVGIDSSTATVRVSSLGFPFIERRLVSGVSSADARAVPWGSSESPANTISGYIWFYAASYAMQLVDSEASPTTTARLVVEYNNNSAPHGRRYIYRRMN